MLIFHIVRIFQIHLFMKISTNQTFRKNIYKNEEAVPLKASCPLSSHYESLFLKNVQNFQTFSSSYSKNTCYRVAELLQNQILQAHSCFTKLGCHRYA